MTVRFGSMRRLLAALLLVCVGILIPAGATPVRFCFLELGLNSAQEESKCCPDCNQDTKRPDPCCLDLEELPDARAPQLPRELPPAVVVDAPSMLCPSPVMTVIHRDSFFESKPIRGPTSPAAYRAVLGIWRL